MRLLDRYLLRELLIPLGYCLCGFMLFYIAFDLVSQLHSYQEHGLVLRDVAELYLVRIPEILVFMMPIVLLLALLYTLTNHARHHELTAIRAAGVGLWRICAPYLIVGLLLSLAVLAINELWVPDSADKEEQIMNRHQANAAASGKKAPTDIAFKNARDGRDWKIGAIDFTPGNCALINPRVIFNVRGASYWLLLANRAEYIDGVWNFYDAGEYLSTNTTASPEPILRTNHLAMPEFSETPAQINREVKFASRLKVRSAQAAEVPIAEILDYLDLHPNLEGKNRWWLYTQLHGRLAAPWTCLVVVLIAIPFGAASGRRNVFVGVAGSIVICFVYFVLLKLGLALGTGGYLPAFIAAWLPNLFFGITGFWLMLRVR